MTFKYVEPAIYELLKNVIDVNSVCWMKAPDNKTPPFIIYQQVDSNEFAKNTLNRAAGETGKVQAFIQVDSYDTSPSTAKENAKAIEEILAGYSGTVYYGTDSPQNSVEISAISMQNDVDTIDETDEPSLHRNSAVYLITYQQ